MDVEKIRKNTTGIILGFAIPAVISMVLESMINIVDGFFMGNYIGTDGLAAVNLGLPIVYLYLAVGLMISVGGSAIAGRLFGAGKAEETNQVFRQTMVVTIIISVLLTVAFVFLLEPISNMFHANTETKQYFIEYHQIMIWQFPMMIITASLGMFIRAEGNPMFVMVTNILNVLLNIVLDYILIVKFSLGVKGNAWGSLIATVVVLGLNIWYFLVKSRLF